MVKLNTPHETKITARLDREKFYNTQKGQTGQEDVIKITFEGKDYWVKYDPDMPASPIYIDCLLDEMEMEPEFRAAAREHALFTLESFCIEPPSMFELQTWLLEYTEGYEQALKDMGKISDTPSPMPAKEWELNLAAKQEFAYINGILSNIKLKCGPLGDSEVFDTYLLLFKACEAFTKLTQKYPVVKEK